QAGSSIMPGKVNPVIPEAVNQIAFAVIGRDVTVTMAAEGGQLQLNPFEPIIALSLLDSLHELRVGYDMLADKCVSGITPNTAGLREATERSMGLITALLPVIGYERATELAAQARAPEANVLELLRAEGMDAAAIEELLLSSTATPAGAPVTEDLP